MKEGTAIAGLVLAQLRGIHEEAVAGGEQQPRARRARRQAVAQQVVDDDGGIVVLGLQVLPELVAQVAGGIPLGEDGGRGVTVNAAMVGGEQHRDPAALGFPQGIEQR